MALLLNAGDTVSRSYSYTQPSPLHPSQPQGTGERTGNLFDKSTALLNYYINDGNGAVSKSTEYNTSASMPIEVEGLDYIYPSTNGYTGTRQWAAFYDGSGNYISGFNGYNIAKAVPSNAKTVRFTVHSSYIDAFSVNAGSTALPYEPYGQYKIPISSANTTTNIYLGEVESTRKITKYVFTGEEDWSQTGAVSNTFYIVISGYLRQRGVNITICSHYTSQTNINGAAEMQDGNVSFYANAGQPFEYFYVRDSNLATAADFKSYLAQQYAAGTPVTVWYVLATPETAVVNEPLMRIGDYADEVSNVSIPVTAGGDTISVDTTLQPSEVTVNYKGWHPVADVHKRESGAWT